MFSPLLFIFQKWFLPLNRLPILPSTNTVQLNYLLWSKILYLLCPIQQPPATCGKQSLIPENVSIEFQSTKLLADSKTAKQYECKSLHIHMFLLSKNTSFNFFNHFKTFIIIFHQISASLVSCYCCRGLKKMNVTWFLMSLFSKELTYGYWKVQMHFTSKWYTLNGSNHFWCEFFIRMFR